jgi:hypothetical protein
VKRTAPLRRRGPLPRSAPMERSTWLRRRRDRPRRDERVRDPGYLADVRELVRLGALGCYAALTVPGHRCDGPIELDHQGERAAGRKADDDTVVPLCQLAHQQRGGAGPWRSWDKPRHRQWRAEGIEHTRAVLAAFRYRRAA